MRRVTSRFGNLLTLFIYGDDKTMKTMAFLGASALAAGTIALTGAFAPAQALTPTGVACDAALFDPMYIVCEGAFQGNDIPNNEAEILALFTTLTSDLGFSGTWAVSTDDKSDSSGNGVFTSNPEETEGTLTFDTTQFGLFGITLKAANSFSVYLFDGGTEGITSIDFQTIGTATNPQGTAQDLSHASFFSFTPDHTPVPEPAAAVALTVFGLVGLGMKKKSHPSA